MPETAAPISTTPDLGALEIPTDAWTEPFWEATAEGRIIMPHCTNCGTYRWPPGPFCPECTAQEVAWTDAGQGRLYSYTIAPRPAADGTTQIVVPALIEFPEAGGVRLIAALVETPIDAIRIGAPVRAGFSQALNGQVPVFTIVPEAAA